MEMMPPKRAVLFDLDGTLVDSMGAFADIAARIISREYGIPRDEARRAYLRTSGIPFFQQLEELFPGRERNPRLAAEFESAKLDDFFAEEYFPDVLPALAGLKAMGYVLAVSSNNFQSNVEAFVGSRGFAFDLVLGFRPGFEKGKDHFDHLCRQAHLIPGDLLFVGDSLQDGHRALGYGADFAGRTGTFSRQQFLHRFPGIVVVDSLLELPPLLSAVS